jgi:hypothetical protein
MLMFYLPFIIFAAMLEPNTYKHDADERGAAPRP